ncbi:MAG: sensor domain-containing diguanylate cyclase [Longimicrobiales bacterium]
MDERRQLRSGGLRERYAVLLDIGRILTGTLRTDDLYQAVYEQASRVLPTASCYIALYDRPADAARIVFYVEGGREVPVHIAYRGSLSTVIRDAVPTTQSTTDPAYVLLRLRAPTDAPESAIAAPILSDGQVLGVLGVQTPGADAYSDQDLELLQTVAALAGIALGSAEYIKDTERRRHEAERLEAIGRALAASLELDDVLRRATDATLELIEADGAAILLNHGDRLRIAALGGNAPGPLDESVELAGSLRTRLFEQRESLVLENLGTNRVFPAVLVDPLEAASAIAAPLIAGEQVIGVLVVGQAHPAAFDSEDLRLLERLSFHVAIAVENARLHEQIRALSLTDPLTGLSNRRHLELVLEKEFAAATRGRKLAIVLFDLDHFKRYNDSVGHQAGDDALRAFAHVLATETRAFDLAARYGGDEFLCILSDSPPDGALAYVTRVGRAVDRHPILGAIGVTAGCATYGDAMLTPADLVHAADRDLYRKKAQRAAR